MKKEKTIVLFLVLLICGIVWIGFLGFVNEKSFLKLSPDERGGFDAEGLTNLKNEPSLSEIDVFDTKAIEARKNLILTNGKDIQTEGTLEKIIIDDFETWRSETQDYLRDSEGKRFRVYFDDEPGLVSGTKISIKGKEMNNEIVEEGYEIVKEEGFREEDNFVLGEQRVAVVLLKNGDYYYESPSYIQDFIFNRNDFERVNNYMYEVSYNKMWFGGDVYGWYDLHQGEPCSFIFSDNFMNELINLGIPLEQYDYLHVIRQFDLNAPQGCAFATLGKQTHFTQNGPILIGVSGNNYQNGLASLYGSVHEIGHNLGLGHANRIYCNGQDSLRDGCKDFEYGNFYNVMGQGYIQSFDAAHKDLLGWFDFDDIIEVSQSGEYVIKPYEIASDKPKILKIEGKENINFTDDWGRNNTGNITDFYIEFRRPISYDDFFRNGTGWSQQDNHVPTDYQDGALMTFFTVNYEFNGSPYPPYFSPWSHQVDFNPGVPNNTGNPGMDAFYDGADVILRQGQTSDSIKYGFSLTVLEVTNNSLKVQINFSEQTQYLTIKNNNEDIVAKFSERGDILLNGQCSIQSSCTAPTDSFKIKNSNGEVVAYVDNSGNLCVKGGSCSQSNPNCDAVNPAFSIKNSQEEKVITIDQNGTLCFVGSLGSL